MGMVFQKYLISCLLVASLVVVYFSMISFLKIDRSPLKHDCRDKSIPHINSEEVINNLKKKAEFLSQREQRILKFFIGVLGTAKNWTNPHLTENFEGAIFESLFSVSKNSIRWHAQAWIYTLEELGFKMSGERKEFIHSHVANFSAKNKQLLIIVPNQVYTQDEEEDYEWEVRAYLFEKFLEGFDENGIDSSLVKCFLRGFNLFPLKK